MLEERIVELIHRDIDRDIAETERGELRDRLEHDPDARLFYDEIQSVAEFLQQAPADEPPADFTASVMTAVRASSATAPAAVPAQILPFTRKYAALPLGLGLAAAVLIAFFAAPSLFRSLDSTHVGGTMLEPPRVAVPQEWTTAAGAVHVSVRGDNFSVTVEPAAEATRVAEMTFDANAIHIDSIHDAIGTQSALGRVEVSVRGTAAVINFVRLVREPVSLTVKLHGVGAETFSGRIEIPANANY